MIYIWWTPLELTGEPFFSSTHLGTSSLFPLSLTSHTHSSRQASYRYNETSVTPRFRSRRAWCLNYSSHSRFCPAHFTEARIFPTARPLWNVAWFRLRLADHFWGSVPSLSILHSYPGSSAFILSSPFSILCLFCLWLSYLSFFFRCWWQHPYFLCLPSTFSFDWCSLLLIPLAYSLDQTPGEGGPSSASYTIFCSDSRCAHNRVSINTGHCYS